jgi:purine-binding chemotaxis protein CheW
MGGERTDGPTDEAPPSIVDRAQAASAVHHVLLVRAASWLCALPITGVVETMRALPVRPIAGAPPFVRGVSVIRGALLPVVHLGALLGGPLPGSGGRFVTVRTGARQVALHVDAVIGAKHIEAAALSMTPPLLSEALPSLAEKIGALDGQMVAWLRLAHILPDDVWGRMLGEGQG